MLGALAAIGSQEASIGGVRGLVRTLLRLLELRKSLGLER